jgi:hypothetical protein
MKSNSSPALQDVLPPEKASQALLLGLSCHDPSLAAVELAVSLQSACN